MSWLNTGSKIDEGTQVVTERQTAPFLDGSVWTVKTRTRTLTYTRERYVGMTGTAAATLVATLSADSSYADVRSDRVDAANQFHVVGTKLTEGAWSDWA